MNPSEQGPNSAANSSSATSPSPSPNALTQLSAERTLLAWIRTGLALMGFGFVVARFGLFLREMAETRGIEVPRRSGMSLAIGVTLVLLGVAVNLGAPIQHWQRMRRIERGQPVRFHPWSLGILLAVVLALVGLAIAGYLSLELHSRSVELVSKPAGTVPILRSPRSKMGLSPSPSKF